MGRALVVIVSDKFRAKAAHWVNVAPVGTRVEFKSPKRTLPQNSRLWAMLTDIATQCEHAGNHYTPDQWKVIFMHACGREVQFLPGLDQKTFIPWGQSSSDLSIKEMTDLIEFMFAWGSEHGVVFSEPDKTAEMDKRLGVLS